MSCKECNTDKVFCEDCVHSVYETYFLAKIFNGCDLVERRTVENTSETHRHKNILYDADKVNRNNTCNMFKPLTRFQRWWRW